MRFQRFIVPPAWFVLPANRRPRHYWYFWTAVIVVMMFVGFGARWLFFAADSVQNNVADALPTEVPTVEPTAAVQVAVAADTPTVEPTFTPLPSPTPTIPSVPSPEPEPTLIPAAEIVGTALVTDTHGVLVARSWMSGFVTDITKLNVRRGAGTNYRSFTTLTGGTEVKVLARNGPATWVLVLLENGTTGWVSATYVAFTQGTVVDLPISNEPATSGEEQPLPAGFGG